MFQYCRDRLTKEAYDEENDKADKSPTFLRQFYRRKIVGDFSRAHRMPKKWPQLNITDRHREFEAMAKHEGTEITQGDWSDCVSKYKDNPRALIFLDPPYFASYNQTYYDGKKSHDSEGHTLDNTSIFIDFLTLLESSTARVLMITSGPALLRYVYRDYIRQEYAHTYGTMVATETGFARHKTSHIIMDNFKAVTSSAQVEATLSP